MTSSLALRGAFLALLLSAGLAGCRGGEPEKTTPAIATAEDALFKAEITAAARGRSIGGRKPRIVQKNGEWQVRFTSPGGRALDGSRDFTITLDSQSGQALTVIDHANR